MRVLGEENNPRYFCFITYKNLWSLYTVSPLESLSFRILAFYVTLQKPFATGDFLK